MLNVLIVGVGGQGSVLASKILAQAAAAKGWQVRTAETIGMAQRGGNVASHVRMGNLGEPVFAPLIARGTADCIIALEPGEGLRSLDYLAADGLLVTASTGIASVTANLAGVAYDPAQVLDYLRNVAPHVCVVDDQAICAAAGSRKALNVGMLGAAVSASIRESCGLRNLITPQDLDAALALCVKPQYLNMNLKALNVTPPCGTA